MKKANWVLGVAMLACAGLVSSQRASHAQADEELRPEEYGAFAAVCDRELTAVGEKATRPLCVRVPPRKSPPERLLRYLRMARVPVSAQRACYPRHQLPRGMEISLEKIRRLPGPILELKVDQISFPCLLYPAAALRPAGQTGPAARVPDQERRDGWSRK